MGGALLHSQFIFIAWCLINDSEHHIKNCVVILFSQFFPVSLMSQTTVIFLRIWDLYTNIFHNSSKKRNLHMLMESKFVPHSHISISTYTLTQMCVGNKKLSKTVLHMFGDIYSRFTWTSFN
jgi:hypothetical protein